MEDIFTEILIQLCSFEFQTQLKTGFKKVKWLLRFQKTFEL